MELPELAQIVNNSVYGNIEIISVVMLGYLVS
jgi:hypothetical protein